ncbi:unnamed protein product, partial [Bubo scandiacus]
QPRSLRAAQRGRGCSAAGGSGGCRARGGRAAGRRERRRAGAGQPPRRCRARAESGREVPPDAPSPAAGCGAGRVIPALPLATAGTGRPGRGMLGDRSREGRAAGAYRGGCCEEPGGRRGGVWRPPGAESRGAAGAGAGFAAVRQRRRRERAPGSPGRERARVCVQGRACRSPRCADGRARVC